MICGSNSSPKTLTSVVSYSAVLSEYLQIIPFHTTGSLFAHHETDLFPRDMGVTRVMKDRSIRGDRVVLVPYAQEHVEKYHMWMKDPDLLFLTGSEPLSLEQEYEMQQKWCQDEDKCTFIVLDAVTYDKTGDQVAAMIGDTNIYFADAADLSTGEIELMIADPSFRSKGYGREVLNLMIEFARQVIGVTKLIAKIKVTNNASLRMFSRMGFVLVGESEVFQEKTLHMMFGPCDQQA